MTQLIDKTDPRYFEQTCYKSYDKHKYKLHLESGKVEIYEYYDELLARWFSTPYCKYVEVMDRKKRK